jgi:hypothetical protein
LCFLLPILMFGGYGEFFKSILSPLDGILHPTAVFNVDSATIIHQVRALARLETIQYTVEKVITAEVGQGDLGFLFGDRLLLVAHGVVIGGVDLSQMSEADVTVEGTVVSLRLPMAEILVATLDNTKSYVYNRETGLLTHGDYTLESRAREVAENEILKAAVEDGILTMAQQNAEHYLRSLLLGLGFTNVIFLDPYTPTPVPSGTPVPTLTVTPATP